MNVCFSSSKNPDAITFVHIQMINPKIQKKGAQTYEFTLEVKCLLAEKGILNKTPKGQALPIRKQI